MTAQEQFDALNTPDWLTAFRQKVEDVRDTLSTKQTDVPLFRFKVLGVNCEVEPINERDAIARIGKDDSGGWMYTINAPMGWFQTPTVT